MQTLDFVDALNQRDAKEIPDFRAGDTVRVNVKVVEGNRSRVQAFQGVVIARAGDGIRQTFTVRKVSFGVGVERTFPLHSPTIESIEVVTRGDVRRAKLYYLRDRHGKAAKIRERREDTRARQAQADSQAEAVADAAAEAAAEASETESTETQAD